MPSILQTNNFTFIILTLQENSTGEEVISHEKPIVPVSTGVGTPPDPNTLFGQLNLPPDLANVLQSFQQGGTLPPNLDQGSAQNILASMMVSRHSMLVPQKFIISLNSFMIRDTLYDNFFFVTYRELSGIQPLGMLLRNWNKFLSPSSPCKTMEVSSHYLLINFLIQLSQNVWFMYESEFIDGC